MAICLRAAGEEDAERCAAIRAGSCVRLGAGRVIRACGIRNLPAFLRASACFDRIREGRRGPRRYLTLHTGQNVFRQSSGVQRKEI